jgi:hypothetical protein
MAPGDARTAPWGQTGAGDRVQPRAQEQERSAPHHPAAWQGGASRPGAPSAGRGGCHSARPAPERSPRGPGRASGARWAAGLGSASAPGSASRRLSGSACGPAVVPAAAEPGPLWGAGGPLGPCWQPGPRRGGPPGRRAAETPAVCGPSRGTGGSRRALAPAGHTNGRRNARGPGGACRLWCPRLHRPRQRRHPSGSPPRDERTPTTAWPTGGRWRTNAGRGAPSPLCRPSGRCPTS